MRCSPRRNIRREYNARTSSNSASYIYRCYTCIYIVKHLNGTKLEIIKFSARARGRTCAYRQTREKPRLLYIYTHAMRNYFARCKRERDTYNKERRRRRKKARYRGKWKGRARRAITAVRAGISSLYPFLSLALSVVYNTEGKRARADNKHLCVGT